MTDHGEHYRDMVTRPIRLSPEDEAMIIALLAEERHIVYFRDEGWTVQHPLRERLDGNLFDCEFTWGHGDPGFRGAFYIGPHGGLQERVT